MAIADNATTRGWSPEPDSESGTASVIWQCLTAIGLCTYVVVHVNISSVPLGDVATFLRKCFVVLIGVVFPEIWAWGAVSQLIEARKLVKRSKNLGRFMTIKQAFFIYSGGVAIRDLHQCLPSVKPEDLKGNTVVINSKSVWFRNWKLQISDEEIMMFANKVPSEEEIDDKSKQDTLVKIITSLQAIWFVVQMAARGQQGLVIIPMQIATLAYISMAAFTYGCWWHKAYDVKVPSVIEGRAILSGNQPDIDTKAWFVAEDRNKFKKLFSSRARLLRPLAEPFYQAGKAAAYDVHHIVAIGANQMMTMGALTSLFTSVHCAAWNYPFPTAIESLLWRIFVCGGIAIGPWAWIETTRFSSGVWWRSGNKWWGLGYIVYEILWGVFSLMYLLSRLYVMTESFLAFRSAPASIYKQVEWSSYVPHFGA